MRFHYYGPWLEETHLSSRCQAAWELVHQCKPHEAGQWESFNGFQAVEVEGFPLEPPQKKLHHLITGNRDSYCVYIFTVSSIQEAKLVCIVFVFFFEMLVCNHSLTSLNWKILKISTRISKVYSGSQLWRLTQGAPTGKFISWKKPPPMVLQGKILVETLLDANKHHHLIQKWTKKTHKKALNLH